MISLKSHALVALDVLAGLTLGLSPWILDYRIFLTPAQEFLHYLLGVGLFALVGLSRERTEADKRHHGLGLGAHHVTNHRV